MSNELKVGDVYQLSEGFGGVLAVVTEIIDDKRIMALRFGREKPLEQSKKLRYGSRTVLFNLKDLQVAMEKTCST